MRLVELAQKTIAGILAPGDVAVDATVGNGLDTLFLARCVGPAGMVYAMDIQPTAIAIAEKKLRTAGFADRIRLETENHANLDRIIAIEHKNRINAVMFNLGYLPGSDTRITTQPSSTRIALQSACRHLSNRGRITVLCYTAHPGGSAETEAVRRVAAELPENFRITIHRPQRIAKSPPELVIIERHDPAMVQSSDANRPCR